MVRAGYGYETVALSEDCEWAEAEAGRLVALAASRNPGSSHSAFDGPGTVESVQQHYPFEVYDVGSHPEDGDPSDEDASTDAIIARLRRGHPGVFGLDKPQSGNRKGRLAGPYPKPARAGSPRT